LGDSGTTDNLFSLWCEFAVQGNAGATVWMDLMASAQHSSTGLTNSKFLLNKQSSQGVIVANIRTLRLDCNFEERAAIEMHFEVISGGGSFALVANSGSESTAIPIQIRH